MDHARIERAARLLVDARKTGRKLAGLPVDSRPQTAEEALAVQEFAMRLNGARPGAWKVGGPPGSGTTYAPIYSVDVYESPARIPLAKYEGLQVEGEVAFRLRDSLPGSGRPYSADQVARAVHGVCAAFEIGVSRFVDFNAASLPEKIADSLNNGGFVYASAASSWRSLDWRTLHVTMKINGNDHLDKTGGKPGSDPFTLLVWAANHINGSLGLRANEFVTTGSWTGLYAARPGDEISVAFDGIGEVWLRCD